MAISGSTILTNLDGTYVKKSQYIQSGLCHDVEVCAVV